MKLLSEENKNKSLAYPIMETIGFEWFCEKTKSQVFIQESPNFLVAERQDATRSQTLFYHTPVTIILGNVSRMRRVRSSIFPNT